MNALFAIGLLFSKIVLADLSCDILKKDSSSTIGYLKLTDGFCTAVLVSPQVVLTAAHCVKDQDPDVISFGLHGTMDSDAQNQIAGVDQYVVHPSYWKSNDGGAGGVDLALVKLKSANYGLKPAIYLPFAPNVDIKKSDQFISWGYGLNEIGKKEIRRKKTVTFDKFEAVLSKEGTKMNDVNIAFSRGETGEIQCFGDSGGPVLRIRNDFPEIIAINSRGRISIQFSSQQGLKRKLASKEFMCQNSKQFKTVAVPLYLDWIESTIKKLEPGFVRPVCSLK